MECSPYLSPDPKDLLRLTLWSSTSPSETFTITKGPAPLALAIMAYRMRHGIYPGVHVHVVTTAMPVETTT